MIRKLFVFITMFVLLLSGCSFSSDPVYIENVPEEYRYLNTISQIRVALPENVLKNQLDLSSISIQDTDTDIKELSENKYLMRYENYGFMSVGPDIFVLSAKDRNLFSLQIGVDTTPETVQYILRSEVGLGKSISAVGAVRSQYNKNSKTVKLMLPIRLSSFSFSDTLFEGDYEGYAALIQKEDFLSAICIAVQPSKRETSFSCETICQSFVLDNIDEFDTSSYYTTYSNILPSLSYENGGLPEYDGYSYKNIGTEKMDSRGTYNKINENIGMYCFVTDFGPLNLPYLLQDLSLESYVTEEPFSASIQSSQDELKYNVSVKERGKEDFEYLVQQLKTQIQQKKELLKKQYPSCRVISEDILDDSNAVITLCGWNRESGEITTVYYKLNTGKDLYSITTIESTQIAGQTIPSLLKEITELSGIVLVVNTPNN